MAVPSASCISSQNPNGYVSIGSMAPDGTACTRVAIFPDDETQDHEVAKEFLVDNWQ